MKIRLLIDLPVDKKHNMHKGRVLEAEQVDRHTRGGVHWWVSGEGEKVGVLYREAEVVAEAIAKVINEYVEGDNE